MLCERRAAKTVARAVLADIDSRRMLDRLNELANSLATALGNPAHEPYQSQVRTLLGAIEASLLENSSSGPIVPFHDQILRDAGIGRFTPRAVAASIQSDDDDDSDIDANADEDGSDGVL